MNNERVHEKVFLYSISSRVYISGFSSGWEELGGSKRQYAIDESERQALQAIYIYIQNNICIFIETDRESWGI